MSEGKMQQTERLHIVTPLLESPELFSLVDRKVWLKMENMQPGGSFKIRGIGRTMQEAVEKGGINKFIGSSGGNAGMAMAVAAKRMNVPLTIYIPTSTKPFMVDKLRGYGADVVVVGDNWNQANEQAKQALSEVGTFMVHPYDQADTWLGHSSLIDELHNQLDKAPGCVVSCVGGGGLVLGLLQGLDRVGWQHVPVLAMETEGAHCLSAAREAGTIIQLPAITSVATSLGALSVCSRLFERCQDQPNRVISRTVTDKQATSACVQFADHLRVLVEPSCGAALSGIYSGIVNQLENQIPQGDIVVVVCGGNIVNLDLINQWRAAM